MIKASIKTAIGLNCLLLSTLSMAADMSKDEWLKKLKDVAPATICKSFTQNDSFNKAMQAVNINYDKCLTLIPASYDKCQVKYYAQIPSMLTQADAEKWGGSIGECIGSDFALNHLTPSTSTLQSDPKSTAPAS
jgi:hypothetical protein